MKYIIALLLLTSVAYAEKQKAIITYYDACVKCCRKTDGITASGEKAKENRTIAVPKNIPFGTKIAIGCRTYTAEDRGSAIKYVDGYMKIDIYVKSHKEAKKLGTYKTIVNIKR